MIPYPDKSAEIIPASSVKIIGLGGAGTNMLERIALDGMEGIELLALHTDVRTLGSCLAAEKIQLGANLTKGLGAGGDPDLGRQAALEAEDAVRESIKGRRVVFLCCGLGGGTSSGAAPIVARIAREEGAFVIVFTTMPFAFEGGRRREQADAALNELAVLANALVTFDNNRMGELVLAKQGIHEAFTAADHMICEAIRAVIRLVLRPGLIHIGLDDLMSALRTTRSRCLFGCGAAEGGDRAAKALRGALASPLLDQGALLKEARTVLVHLCGGEDLTLFEIELMMQSLAKHVPENAHVLFGAAVDPAMGNRLSVTVMSSLPEDSLVAATLDSLSRVDDRDKPLLDSGRPAPAAKPPGGRAKARRASVTESAPGCEEESGPAAPAVPPDPVLADLFTEPAPVTEPQAEFPETSGEVVVTRFVSASGDGAVDDKQDDPPPMAVDAPMTGPETMPEAGPAAAVPDEAAAVRNPGPRPPKLKLGIKVGGSQSELSLDATPRGRFEGENPNVVDGEDLDLPPFLRKKK